MENLSLIKPINEFILWDNCGNNCKFCYQKKHYNCSSKDDMLKALGLVDDVLSDKSEIKFEQGSHILLVGGEIFDITDIDVKIKFLEVSKKILEHQKNGNLKYFYINTNLLYEDTDFLLNFLELVNKAKQFENLKFTTSWDFYGRFHFASRIDLFDNNLSLIKRLYPDINIVVNTILSKQLCEHLLFRKRSLSKFFQDEFSCQLNLLPYVAIDDEMTPERNDVLNILVQEENLNPGYIKSYINSFDIPQQKLIYRYKNGNFEFASAGNSDCGHGINFKQYSTKGSCFICDIKELFNYE